jgi:hypothetical protein
MTIWIAFEVFPAQNCCCHQLCPTPAALTYLYVLIRFRVWSLSIGLPMITEGWQRKNPAGASLSTMQETPVQTAVAAVHVNKKQNSFRRVDPTLWALNTHIASEWLWLLSCCKVPEVKNALSVENFTQELLNIFKSGYFPFQEFFPTIAIPSVVRQGNKVAPRERVIPAQPLINTLCCLLRFPLPCFEHAPSSCNWHIRWRLLSLALRIGGGQQPGQGHSYGQQPHRPYHPATHLIWSTSMH